MKTIKNPIDIIKNSYLKSLKGEESFWVVLFGWGAGFYIASLVSGFYVARLVISPFLNKHTLLSDLAFFPVGAVGLLGLILVFIYPAIFAFSLIQCSKKYSWIFLLFSTSLILAFFFLHYLISQSLVFAVSWLMMSVSISGATIMTIVFIYILIKTAKALAAYDKKSHEISNDPFINNIESKNNFISAALKYISFIFLYTAFVFLISTILNKVILPAVLNHQGICLKTLKKLSDQEKIQLTLSEIANRQKVCIEEKDNGRGVKDGLNNCYEQIPMKNVEEYLQKNSDCCLVIKDASGSKDSSSNLVFKFIALVTDSKSSDIVRVKYLAHYFDKKGEDKSEWVKFYATQDNCGKIFEIKTQSETLIQ